MRAKNKGSGKAKFGASNRLEFHVKWLKCLAWQTKPVGSQRLGQKVVPRCDGHVRALYDTFDKGSFIFAKQIRGPQRAIVRG